MRSYMTILRSAPSTDSRPAGHEAAAILSRIDGVSHVAVVRQVIDGVMLSFVSTGHTCGQLDELLHAKGLRRM